jgi:hypothetical protein
MRHQLTRSLLIPFWLLCPHGAASATPAGEAEVKALLIANMTHYTEWPLDLPGNQLRGVQICVMGRGATAEALLRLDGKTINDIRLSIATKTRIAQTADECQVVFIGESNPGLQIEWLAALAERPVLTVAEGDELCLRGSIVGIVVDNRRVAFDINLGALKRTRLKLSAQLLRLARRLYNAS